MSVKGSVFCRSVYVAYFLWPRVRNLHSQSLHAYFSSPELTDVIDEALMMLVVDRLALFTSDIELSAEELVVTGVSNEVELRAEASDGSCFGRRELAAEASFAPRFIDD